MLYETLGPTLPEGLAGAAALWGLAQRCAMTYPEAVRRAGHADGDALFDAILEGRSGITFTVDEYEDDFATSPTPTGGSRSTSRRCSTSSRALRDAQPGWPATSSRSSCRRASGAPTPPTTSSATPGGASATAAGRCASAPRTPRGSASPTAAARG